jgi:thioesterase domain-containing protein
VAYHRPEVFDGDLVFIGARGRDCAEAQERWSPFVTGEVAAHSVDCRHVDMLTPRPARRIGRIITSGADRDES